MCFECKDIILCKHDKFQYLNFQSSHPYHQKASLPFGLALRIKRICSNNEDFKRHCETLIVHLRKRGFKLGLIKEAIRKAAQIDRNELLSPKDKQQQADQKMIFTTTYNPMIPHLRQKIHDLHPILHSSQKCQVQCLIYTHILSNC